MPISLFPTTLNSFTAKVKMSEVPTEIPTRRRLEGKVALITGGASGIGEATARLYVKYGAKVLIADIQDELGYSLCNNLGSEETISYIHCDVSNDSDVKNAVNLAVSKYGKLDIMFNNAGIGEKNMISSIADADNDEFKRVIDVNLFGAFLGAKHAARVMIPAKKGCILFTSSLVSLTCTGPGFPGYVASKHAIVGLAKNLCVELGQHGIRVNCISPYLVATPLVVKSLPNVQKRELQEMSYEAANLKEVFVEEEDVAEAAVYLGSDESKYVSGINLPVDGGFRLVNPTLTMAMMKQFSSRARFPA